MYKVIDISENQPDGCIDFEKIKKSGVRGVICRAGYGQYSEQKDKCFDVHMRNAASAGHALGAYWFCYARNAEEAIEEANVCHEIIKDYDLNYPIFYDVEGDTVRYMSDNGVTASADLISGIIEAFADRMSELGHSAGVYSNLNFVKNYFDDRVKKYPLWVACYPENSALDDKFEVDGFNTVMWQYTSTQGNIEGAPAHLDVNICYAEPEGTIGNTQDTAAGGTESGTSCDTKYHVGDYVYYSSIYNSSDSKEALKPAISEGTVTKVIQGARNPYLINDGTGWVNDEAINNSDVSEVQEDNTSFYNSKVRFVGNTNYNGVPVTAYFNDDGYDVGEINGDRAVLYHNGDLFDAVRTSDIEVI